MIHRTRLNIRPDRWGKGYARVTADVEVKAGENLFWN